MKKALPWIVTTILLAGAWLVTFWTPTEEDITAPFVVEAELGKPAVGRAISITIDAVQTSDEIFIAGEPDDHDEWTAERPTWTMDGTWVVFTVDAQSNTSQVGSAIRRAVLVIGDRTYWADERMPSLADSVALVPGVPRHGNIAFEIPPDAREESATLQISLNSDERVDSVIEFDVDLATLPVEDEIEIVPTDWTNR